MNIHFQSYTPGQKGLIKRDSNSDVRKMWFLEDNTNSENISLENKETLGDEKDIERGKRISSPTIKSSAVLPSITLGIASLPIKSDHSSKNDNTKDKPTKSSRDRR